MSAIRPLRPEDYKCWICLDTEPGERGTSEWRRTCPCSLVAHETCLLQWANEMANSNESVKIPSCPQCRKPIVIVQGKTFFLHARDVIESANSTSIKLFMGAAIGGSAMTALYTTLYTLGATSIRFMCSPEMALDILGIVVKSTGIEIHPVSFRKALLIPTIPIALIASRTSSRIIDVLLCLLPFALADRSHPPWKFSGPRLTVSLIPVLRLAYFRLYNLIAQPIIDSSARNMRTGSSRSSNALGIEGLNFGVEVVVEEEIVQPNQLQNANNQRNGAAAAEGGQEGIVGNMMTYLVNWALRRVQENNPQRGDFNGNDINGGLDENVMPNENENDNANENDERQGEQPLAMANGHANNRVRGILNQRQAPLRAPMALPDTNWVISPRRLSLTIGNALLLPFFSNLLGLGLARLPFIQWLVPDHFQRNVLGGILVIGVKDIVNVCTSYLRMKQERSTRVLQLTEVENIDS